MPRIPDLPNFAGAVSGSDELPLYDASSDRTYGATVDDLAAYIGTSSAARPTVVQVPDLSHDPELGVDWRYFVCTNASGCLVIIPSDDTVPFPLGTLLTYEQANTGQITVAGGTAGPDGEVFINYRLTKRPLSAGLGSVIFIIKTAANTWTLYGDLADL